MRPLFIKVTKLIACQKNNLLFLLKYFFCPQNWFKKMSFFVIYLSKFLKVSIFSFSLISFMWEVVDNKINL